MFTGLNNTNLITSSCTESNIAAKLCSNFTFEGFDDWYLGSIDEFIKLQKQFNVAPEQLIASGRSSYQPLVENDSRENRSKDVHLLRSRRLADIVN